MLRVCPLYDHEVKRWRHLNFWQHATYLSAKVPRVEWRMGTSQVMRSAAMPPVRMRFFVYMAGCEPGPLRWAGVGAAAPVGLLNAHDAPWQSKLWLAILHLRDDRYFRGVDWFLRGVMPLFFL